MFDFFSGYLIDWGLPAALLVAAYFIGSAIERSHFRRIRAKEHELSHILIFAIRRVPKDLHLAEPWLVSGSTVISVDYFKKFAADLRGIVGGRMGTYESLFERARREAIIRMKEKANHGGADIVLNLKLDTARIYAGARGATVSVEAVAYGTAYKTRDK